ncbi:MAG: LamG-like jellyroll fold domain-containing protein [Bythopirellula sp.]
MNFTRIINLATAIAVALLFAAPATQGAVIQHYWDMDMLSGGVPTDVVGGVPTAAEVGDPLLLNATYGAPYAGAGNALQTNLSGTGSAHLLADVHDGGGTAAANATAMNFGSGDFSISYWSYDDAAGDADGRGPRVFDSLDGTTTGIQLGSNLAGVFNYRMDDDAGNAVISNTTGAPFDALLQADDVWTHVSINVSRSTDSAEVFFNGATQGTYDISALTGSIFPTQDMEIGVINGGSAVGAAQAAGLDDLAIYSGLLSQADITGLARGTITPDQIPEPGSIVLLGLGGLALFLRRR